MGLSSIQISMWAFVFSLITVGFVVFISMHSRGNPITVVILAGVMVSSLFSAGVSYTKLVADPNDMLPAITYWLMGSLTGAKFADVKLVILPMAIGLVILLALRWRINILTMGDDEAATMGVNARLVRLLVMVAATLVTASGVAVSGMIASSLLMLERRFISFRQARHSSPPGTAGFSPHTEHSSGSSDGSLSPRTSLRQTVHSSPPSRM